MKRHWTLDIGLWTLFTVGLWTIWTLDVFATTYYVAQTGGNNLNSCVQAQSISTPKSTVFAGIGCLINPGDVLYIRTGTYNENLSPNATPALRWPTVGTAAAPITIASYTGETARIFVMNIQDNVDASVVSYLVFDRILIDGNGGTTGGYFRTGGNTHHITFQNGEIRNTQSFLVVGSDSSNNITIKNNLIHDALVGPSGAPSATWGTYGVYWNSVKNSLIDGNTIYNCTGAGIHFFSSSGINVNDNIIRNNLIYGNGTDDGTRANQQAIITLTSGTRNLIYNNIIYNNTGAYASNAIGLGSSASNTKVYNNTIYNTRVIGIQISSGSSGNLIRNNIVSNNGSAQISDLGSVSSTYSNNVCFGTLASSCPGSPVVSNPLFVNTTTFDFHIQSGSPAKDAGITLAEVPLDKDGFARPQPPGGAYDIGAYEFLSAIPPPLSTISMTFPNGGENLLTGTPVNITWTSNDTHIVKLEVSRDGGSTYPETIVTGIAQTADANNSYTWTPTPPRSLTTKIRVTNLFDLQADESNAVANIRGKYIK